MICVFLLLVSLVAHIFNYLVTIIKRCLIWESLLKILSIQISMDRKLCLLSCQTSWHTSTTHHCHPLGKNGAAARVSGAGAYWGWGPGWWTLFVASVERCLTFMSLDAGWTLSLSTWYPWLARMTCCSAVPALLLPTGMGWIWGTCDPLLAVRPNLPTPARFGLVNARLLVNKTFILKDIFHISRTGLLLCYRNLASPGEQKN